MLNLAQQLQAAQDHALKLQAERARKSNARSPDSYFAGANTRRLKQEARYQAAFAALGGVATAAQLAGHMGLTAQAMATTLRRFESRGLVVESPKDGGRVIVWRWVTNP